jgi:hypothetical protein
MVGLCRRQGLRNCLLDAGGRRDLRKRGSKLRTSRTSVVRLDCHGFGACVLRWLGSGEVVRGRLRKPPLGGVFSPHERVDPLVRLRIDAFSGQRNLKDPHSRVTVQQCSRGPWAANRCSHVPWEMFSGAVGGTRRSAFARALRQSISIVVVAVPRPRLIQTVLVQVAGHAMIRRDLLVHRLHLRAVGHRARAARVEAAA